MAILINGETVEDSVVRQETASLRQQYADSMSGDPLEIEIELRRQAQENVVARTLLRQEAARDAEPLPAEEVERTLEMVRSQSAVKAGCDPRANDEELRREIEGRMRVDRLIEKISSRLAVPRQKDVGEYYRKHRDEFLLPEMIRACHIVKNVDENTTEEAALAAMREIQPRLTADNFAELANECSDCAGNGGDLGYFPRGQMVDEFDDVVFDLKAGETSDIFRTPFGYHIARVVERRPQGVRPLPEVKQEIEDLLFRQKLRKTLDDLIDRLRAKADVQTVRQKAST